MNKETGANLELNDTKDTKIMLDAFSSMSKVLRLDPHEFYKIIGPKSVQLELTNKCNLRCNMCNRWNWVYEINEPKKELSTQEILGLFQQLKELGVAHILLSGGEPLLRKDFEKLLNFLNLSNISTTLITNGTYLPKSIAELLAASNTTIIFSVDGSNKAVYRRIRGRDFFNKVVDNIRYMVEKRNQAQKSKVVMHFVIQKVNVSDMISFYDLCKAVDVDEVSFSLAHGPQVSEHKIGIDESCIEALKKNLTELASYEKEAKKPTVVIRDVLKEFTAGNIPITDVKMGVPLLTQFKEKPVPCLSASYWALIDAWGHVYPCCYAYFDNSSYERYINERARLCFGNIRDQKFVEIWQGEKFNKFRKMMNPVNITEFPQICGQCGSYFFFRRMITEFKSLKKEADKVYEGIIDILSQAHAFITGIERIDRSGNLLNVDDMIKKLMDIEEIQNI